MNGVCLFVFGGGEGGGYLTINNKKVRYKLLVHNYFFS